MQTLDDQIKHLLSVPPYSRVPVEKEESLLAVLKAELDDACRRHPGYANYVRHWPVDYRAASRLASLPFLPVGLFKADPPLCLVSQDEIKRTLTSSATTSQAPSRVAVDLPTAQRMTKGVVAILRDYIGAHRRPYLVVDAPFFIGAHSDMGARAAAIHGLQPFASEVKYCLKTDTHGEMVLDRDLLQEFARAHHGGDVLVYGFTYMLWNHLVKPLLAAGVCLNLPRVRILHSGGWKKLQEQAVEKATFNEGLARVFGCDSNHVIDFYGMVESVGVIFPDCPEGNKHSPAFGEVIVRDPLTLEPVPAGGRGMVQVCSVLPASFPGHLLLTEDLAEVIAYDGCPCGRRGLSFRFAGRIPKAEPRGCGNLHNKRNS